MTIQQELHERRNAAWPVEISSISTAALAAIDTLTEITKSVNMARITAEGIDRLRDEAKPIGKTLRATLASIENAAAQLDHDRKAVRAKALAWPDERARELSAEIAAHVRALPLAEKTQLLFAKDVDADLVRAVLERPAYLTGFPADRFGELESGFLARMLPDETAALERAGEAVEHATVSARALRQAIERQLDFHQHGAAVWLEKLGTPEPPPGKTISEADAERAAAVDARLAALVTA